MKRIAALVVADGRDVHLGRCLASLDAMVSGPIVDRVLHDDTGDDAYRARLAVRFPDWTVIGDGPRRGAAGAVKAAWDWLAENSSCGYVFHLEQDFEICRPVDLCQLAELLDDHPELAQVVLRRDAVNGSEIAAGGVVEQHPDWYLDRADGQGRCWLEHQAYWSNNPCLYRMSLVWRYDWPAHVPGRYSEDTFTQMLRETGTPEAGRGTVRYAYWGARDSGVWVRHLGGRHPDAKGY